MPLETSHTRLMSHPGASAAAELLGTDDFAHHGRCLVPQTTRVAIPGLRDETHNCTGIRPPLFSRKKNRRKVADNG